MSTVERAWFHCPLCPDDVWLPLEERVDLKRPIKIKGHITYGVCRSHAEALLKLLERRRRRTEEDADM